MTQFMALVGFIFFALPASAIDFPQLTGRVVDEAELLDASTRKALDFKLFVLEATTTDQFVVVTVSSLRGQLIEDFGLQLGNYWKIGQKDKNNGVLLIVAPIERKVRIEVGIGLEGKLTNAIAQSILESDILPFFRQGNYGVGIMRGVDSIIAVLIRKER
jgi:uncharacterized protein